eukprot:29935-Pelagococcus_subviridis.AAC.3
MPFPRRDRGRARTSFCMMIAALRSISFAMLRVMVSARFGRARVSRWSRRARDVRTRARAKKKAGASNGLRSDPAACTRRRATLDGRIDGRESRAKFTLSRREV